ncbi:MAG: type II toxin-antitoxin system VapC family toxin [Pseudohongiellaceae bacterium]
MSFVLDNSVAMRWFFGDGRSQELSYAESILDAITDSKAYVPVVWNLEVCNVIARAEHRGLVTQARSDVFLSLLNDLEIEIDEASCSQALSQTLHLSRQYGLSAYDSSYLELALRKNLPLATLDKDLKKVAAKAGIVHFRTT